MTLSLTYPGSLTRPPENHKETLVYLRECLEVRKTQLKWSNNYYEASFRLATIGVGTPPELRKLLSVFGWPRLYIDSIEERLDLINFRLGGASEDVEELLHWWQENDLDDLSSRVHMDALIYGSAFVSVAANNNPLVASPKIAGESPMDMYADVDIVTGEVKAAIRVYADPLNPMRERATLLLPNETRFFQTVNARTDSVDGWVEIDDPVVHNLGHTPVVVFTNRQRLGCTDGTSEIMPELRSVVDAASRAMMNMQAATETMAVPQRLLFGVDEKDLVKADDDSTDKAAQLLDVYLSRMLAFSNSDAKPFQFTAADLRNYMDVIEGLAKIAASYTGLPPQYLSFSTENPASAEAIRSAETRLVKKCERKARAFGARWEQVMRLATLVVRGSVPPEFSRLEAVFRNPATPTQAAAADAATKLYANGAGLIPKKYGRLALEYTPEEIKDMEELDQAERKEKLSMLLEEQEILAPVETEPAENQPAKDEKKPSPKKNGE